MHATMIIDDLNMLTWVSFRTWTPTISRITFSPYGFMITYVAIRVHSTKGADGTNPLFVLLYIKC